MEMYKNKQENEIELKKMYHDLKNLELIVDACRKRESNLEKVEEYIYKMQQYFEGEKSINTRNEILDILLMDIKKQCDAKK